MITFPASLLLFPVTIATGVVYVRLEALRSKPWRTTWRAALVGGTWASPLATTGPGAVQLALGILVAYLGIRMVALGQRRRGRRAPAAGAAAIAGALLVPSALVAK